MNQQGGVGPLALPAVDRAGDVQGRGEGRFVRGEDAGPHRGEAVQALAEVPLLVPGLEIPGGDVVEDGIAEYAVPGLLRFYVPGRFSKDDRQLRLVVQPLHQALIPGDIPIRVPGPGDPLGEIDRRGLFLFKGLRVVLGGFLLMVPVVHPQADHVLPGPGDGGQEGYVLQGNRLGGGGDGKSRRRKGFNQGVHVGIGEKSHALLRQRAHALFALVKTGNQFHGRDPFRM